MNELHGQDSEELLPYIFPRQRSKLSHQCAQFVFQNTQHFLKSCPKSYNQRTQIGCLRENIIFFREYHSKHNIFTHKLTYNCVPHPTTIRGCMDYFQNNSFYITLRLSTQNNFAANCNILLVFTNIIEHCDKILEFDSDSQGNCFNREHIEYHT